MIKIILAVMFIIASFVLVFADEKYHESEAAFLSEINAASDIITETSKELQQVSEATPTDVGTHYIEIPIQSKYLSQNQLEDLLRDRSPEIRKAAVKNSRNYILNSRIHDMIIDILRNKTELVDIRIEAARALCYASSYSRVRDALIDVIKYGNEPNELRIMAYKALWNVAGSYSQVKDFLLDSLRYYEKDREAKKAVIWALFAASNDYRVREVLLDIIKNKTTGEEAIRIEAIKSLYSGMHDYRAKETIIDIVKDKNEKKAVRLTALKALSAVNRDSRVRDLLEDMIRYEKDEELKVGAIEASSPKQSDIVEFFHLGYKIENGAFVNPIEKE